MNEREQYRAIMNEVIGKQVIILGPEIAILKARNVPGIVIDGNGKVTDIVGDPTQALQKLIDVYVELSGQIVKNALGTIFTKYPSLKGQLDAAAVKAP